MVELNLRDVTWFTDHTDSAGSKPRHDYVNIPDYSQDFTPIKTQTDYQSTTLSPSRSYDSALNNIKPLEMQETPVKEK